MARIRSIKPQFWSDEKIASVPIQARLLFIGTWSYADDNGVIRGNPAYIKSLVFPYDDNLRVGEVKKWIDALEEARMLIPLMYKGESYYVIRTFRSHQRIDTRYANELIPSMELEAILSHTGHTLSAHCAPVERTALEMEYIPVSSNEDYGVCMSDNIIYPVEDQNACTREKKNTEGKLPAKCMARKTLRKDDAGISTPQELSWREDFEIYKSGLRMAYKKLIQDDAWISTQQRFYPGMNIALSLEKACVNYWATETGWEHKRKQRTKNINWRNTLTNALSQKQNKVYDDNRSNQKFNNSGVSDDYKTRVYETLLGGGDSA